MNERTVIAELIVEDDMAIKEEVGTLDYLEREALWMLESGIRLGHAMIADDDDESRWQRYLNYLVNWVFVHTGDEFEGMSPACYEEWKNNENEEKN